MLAEVTWNYPNFTMKINIKDRLYWMIYCLYQCTLSEKCINCSAFSFLAEHGKTKYICYHHGKVELASINYSKAVKKSFFWQSF